VRARVARVAGARDGDDECGLVSAQAAASASAHVKAAPLTARPCTCVLRHFAGDAKDTSDKVKAALAEA
jgi:hypothetical protein